jgi:hypothetical protein
LSSSPRATERGPTAIADELGRRRGPGHPYSVASTRRGRRPRTMRRYAKEVIRKCTRS